MPSFSAQTATRLWPYVLISPVFIFLCVFFAYPLLDILWTSVSDPAFGISNYKEFFSRAFYIDSFFRTFAMAFIVTAACLLLGYPVACVIARTDGKLAPVLLGAVTIAFWTSYLVRAYAWMVILGSNGPIAQFLKAIGISDPPQLIYNQVGVYTSVIHALLPYMILTVYAVVRKIDRRYLQASASLGAPPFKQFTTVFVPLSLPGVVNGCTLVFIFALGFYATPALLGGTRDMLLPGLIGQQINELLEWGVAGAMTTILIASSILVFAIYNRLFGLNRLWG